MILMAGLQGAGKTTTSGKLAKLLREQQKKKVLAGELRRLPPRRHRAIAHGWPSRPAIDFFPSETEPETGEHRAAALDHAKRHYHDVLIVDTAGRLAIDEAMMDEIRRTARCD